MKIYAQVLGTATGDSTPTLLIFFDQKRYLFNCGEGTQRFCTEHKIRLVRIKDLFLTRLHWDNTGGLPGLLLTVSDAVQSMPGPHSLSIYGPRHTRNFVTSLRYFINRKHMTWNVREFVENEAYPQSLMFDDGNLRITAVELLLPTETELAACYSVSASSTSTLSDPSEKCDEKEEKKMDIEQDSEVMESEKLESEEHLSPLGTLRKCKRKARGPNQIIYSSVIDSSEYEKGDRSSRIVLARDIGDSSSNLSCTPPKRNKCTSKKSATRGYLSDGKPFSAAEEDAASGRLTPLVQQNQGPSTVVLCYICRSPDLPGKFDPKQAKILGVPSGPLYGRLCKGETITLADGRQIRPSDCIGPSRPGTVFVIVHCPSEDYVDVLAKHTAWKPYIAKGKSFDSVGCIVHITPHRLVTENETYRTWMHSFGPATQHILINEHVCPQRPVFIGATRNHYKLHSLHPEIFPMPYIEYDMPTMPDALPPKVVAGEPLLKFLLAPPNSVGLDSTETLKPLNQQEIDQEIQHNEELLSTKIELHTWLQSFTSSQLAETAREKFGGPERHPRLYFLGTGAALPSKYRNVTSIYLGIPTYGGLLLDAGEGSFGQLARLFGLHAALEVVKELKVVLISHMHADHHLGLLRILAIRKEIAQRSGVAEAGLLVVGPPALKEWLDEYSSQIQALNYRFASCQALNQPSYLKYLNPLFGRFFLGIVELRSAEVVHCPYAYGFAIAHRWGWKIVYSGDTRPCLQLAEIGRGATLLIHEATFEDGMQDEAKAKAHSTTTEALAVGRDMGAEFVVMFHFSQRYPKIPVVEGGVGEERMGIAFDLMSAPFPLLPVLPRLLPPLRALFKEEEVEEPEI